MTKYCHLHASCGWSNTIYVIDAKFCCFEFDLFRAQTCWFAFTNAIRKKDCSWRHRHQHHTPINSPQWKAFGCFYERSNIEKSFLNFPNPKSYAKDRKTSQKWLDNPKNGSLPRKIDKYLWKRADLVCEDHFAPGSFDQINGAFVNDHWFSNLKLWSYCACSSFSRLTQWRCRANTGHIYTRCPAESTCDGFRFPLFSHS